MSETESNTVTAADGEATPAEIVVEQLHAIADELMTILSILSAENTPQT